MRTLSAVHRKTLAEYSQHQPYTGSYGCMGVPRN